MSDRIQKIVMRLPDLKSVTEVWDTAERRLDQGDVAFVADLGIALASRYGSSAAQVWQYRSVFDRLLRLLTTASGQEHVEQALRLVSAASPGNRKLLRYAASLLADGQTPKDLAITFTGGSSHAAASDELRACLVHELVLRDVTIAELPAIEAWATSPHWQHHPLAWLPLELSVIEDAPPLPSYSVGGASYAMPYGPQDGPDVALGSVTPLPKVTEATTEKFREAATAALVNWAEESNGRNEAGTYQLAEPVGAASLPGLLAALRLECLSGVGPRRRLALSACRPEHAWRILFAAASTGGAYNNGVYGAYGRLAAWRSLAALSGAFLTAPVGEVERNIQECDWYNFEAATKWFEGVAWDIGLVSVAAGARRIAVLAATDTD
ncbi:MULTISPECIES: DUF6183 family protein [unclassified Streptomyces]|uniref:DUF6183 family protein n=1 Tax=unclassified Streptomyces TaxID=2593676 RepID=UPI000DBA964B|nr:DUF6183 family protein [Streptomyces sp. PsTaAH-137]MYT69755.1 hypothetical protein [Streptomyces sp. SID8367]